METKKYTAVRRIQFCCGHRVHLHESKCRNMHGHNYVVYFHARSAPSTLINKDMDIGEKVQIARKPELDDVGRVIDFSVLKAKLGTWIDDFWDHGFLWYEDDPEMAAVFGATGANNSHKNYMMPCNPTAENMASYLLNHICPAELEGTGVEVYKVVLWETENCFAEVTL